jgi:N6-L-threonylcarbamoyladenine synthase
MLILGIETSCDETAAAVVEDGTKILSNVVASSIELHQKTGGIIPEVAAREQLKCVLPVVDEALAQAASNRKKLTPRPYTLNPNFIDAIAVTVGPGLIGSLLVGVETAKTLAYAWPKPLMPVNHLQAHLYANWLNRQRPQFPAIGLVVSGGHTDLVLMKNHGRFQWLGGTRDDAAGECFDKCARLLGLGYPGGPAIAAAAAKYQVSGLKSKVVLPRPMIETNNFDFSFSGLKTAVLRETQHLKLKTLNRRINSSVSSPLAFEIQEAITDVLVTKTMKAAEKFKVKSILLAGGVAANQVLRKKFQVLGLKSQVNFFVPPQNLCTDNATYVASFSYFNYQSVPWEKIQADPSLRIEEII